MSRIDMIGLNGGDGEHYIMKTIIAGSRGINDFNTVRDAAYSAPWEFSEIVSGGARGVDCLGEQFGDGINVPVTIFPANWNKYGKSAGYKRNVEMADYADALIAVWDGKSKGTKHMIDIATSKGLKIYVHNIGEK